MSWKFGITQLALAFGLLFFVSGAQAAGQLTVIDKFVDSGSNEFDVAIYFAPEAATGSQKIGLLGIANGTRRNSISFTSDEWPALMALWTKAVGAQSNSWQDVGTYTETGTPDNCTLKISAGPGVTFLISCPARGIETYFLPTDDMARFGIAVRNAQGSLANQGDVIFDKPKARY